MAFHLPLNRSLSFPTSKNSNTLKKNIYSEKIDCFLCLCSNNMVCSMWLWSSYSESLHSQGSYWTDHTNTFHRKENNFCELLLTSFQCDSVESRELTSCRAWIQHCFKIHNYEDSSDMWITLKREPLLLQGPYHAAREFKEHPASTQVFFTLCRFQEIVQRILCGELCN